MVAQVIHPQDNKDETSHDKFHLYLHLVDIVMCLNVSRMENQCFVSAHFRSDARKGSMDRQEMAPNRNVFCRGTSQRYLGTLPHLSG